MHLAKANKLLLILAPSIILTPIFPIFTALSLPAKSTTTNLLIIFSFPYCLVIIN